MIHIRFYANMRTLTGQENLDITYSSAKTLRELFARLIEQFPEMQSKVLDEHNNLRPEVPIFVNGRNPRLTSLGFDMQLRPDDEISLFTPISSGRMNVEVMRIPESDEQE